MLIQKEDVVSKNISTTLSKSHEVVINRHHHPILTIEKLYDRIVLSALCKDGKVIYITNSLNELFSSDHMNSFSIER